MLWIVIGSYDCLLRIVIVNYLKPYNFLETNDYYWIEILTWNHITVYKISVLDENILNLTTLQIISIR